MDRMTPDQRHYTMSRIRGKDTKPETLTRKYLFSKGFRFRKNVRKLPGTPDIVLPKWKTVVFVNGCFWHGHEGCRLYVQPKSNVEYWTEKIERNRSNDRKNISLLEEMGWKVIVLWECELRTKSLRKERFEELYFEIVGEPEGPLDQ